MRLAAYGPHPRSLPKKCPPVSVIRRPRIERKAQIEAQLCCYRPTLSSSLLSPSIPSHSHTFRLVLRLSKTATLR